MGNHRRSCRIFTSAAAYKPYAERRILWCKEPALILTYFLMRTSSEIARRVLEHFRKGGTIDDKVVEKMYREAHGIAPGVATHPRTVEKWAFDAVRGVDLTRSSDIHHKVSPLKSLARTDMKRPR
jgi:hypothetical protein